MPGKTRTGSALFHKKRGEGTKLLPLSLPKKSAGMAATARSAGSALTGSMPAKIQRIRLQVMHENRLIFSLFKT